MSDIANGEEQFPALTLLSKVMDNDHDTIFRSLDLLRLRDSGAAENRYRMFDKGSLTENFLKRAAQDIKLLEALENDIRQSTALEDKTPGFTSMNVLFADIQNLEFSDQLSAINLALEAMENCRTDECFETLKDFVLETSKNIFSDPLKSVEVDLAIAAAKGKRSIREIPYDLGISEIPNDCNL